MKYTKQPSSLPFWKQEHIAQYNFPLVMLCRQPNQLLGRWLGKAPSITDLLKELELAEMAYVRITSRKGESREIVNIVVGRIEVFGGVDTNDEGVLRIWAYKINYADNRTRATLVARGFRIAVKGVHIYSGTQHGDVERQNISIKQGEHALRLLALRDQFGSANADDELDENGEELRTSAEEDLLGTVQQYIDVEYAQEEMTARQTPPFSYISVKAEPRKIVYRQFYRIRFTDGDYARLLELSPSLLRFAGDDEQEGALAQVVNLAPSSDEPEVIISIEKQKAHTEIPETGQLFLTAIPTLQKVRTEVVDKLRLGKTANPWLLAVAAGEYEYPDYKVGDDQPPPATHPPTTSQLQAFRMGLHTPDYILTLGPPGTGKTTVILNWVRKLVEQGERVLVTSQNNKAVDNVLERLAEEKDLQCVRIGSETKVSTNLHPILVDNAATALQQRLAENIDTTLSYLTQCQQYFAELRSNVKPLAEQNLACLALANRRDRHVTNELEPKQRAHAKEIQQQRVIEEKLQALIDKAQTQAFKQQRWQSVHWILKPLSWIALPFIGLKLSAFNWRTRRGQRILSKAKARSDKALAKVAAVEQEIQQQELQLQQALKERAEKFPKSPRSPYAKVDFGFDLSNEHFELDAHEVDAKLNQLSAWKQTVDEWKEALSNMRQQALYAISLEMVDVVGATCIGINTNPAFRNIPFDTVIVDEAGQIQLHNLIVPLSRAKRSILVGDHKQLPPVVQQELIEELDNRGVDTELMKDSWFEQLWPVTNEQRKVILDTQYRCPAIISDYISAAFYEGAYYAGKGMEAKKPLFSFTESPLVFIDTSSLPSKEREEKSFIADGRNQVQNNPLETSTVVSLLERALSEKPVLGEGEIGIVVPYKNHVVAIRSAIRKAQSAGRLSALKTPLVDLVASVDSFQGQERDLIIMTFTRSNARKTVGFLKDWRRLNVGMTRAKSQLIMVGDMHTLTQQNQHRDGTADTAHEFKQAMSMLREFVKQHGQFIDIKDWQRHGSV